RPRGGSGDTGGRGNEFDKEIAVGVVAVASRAVVGDDPIWRAAIREEIRGAEDGGRILDRGRAGGLKDAELDGAAPVDRRGAVRKRLGHDRVAAQVRSG